VPELLLATENLRVAYGRGAKRVEVLHGISIELRPGETLGLVGESGSGKTTLGRAILGLVELSHGSMWFNGMDITRRDRRRQRALAKEMQVVFQDPYTSLNPSMSIEDILTEPLIAQGVPRKQASRRALDVLDRVAMPSDSLRRYSREFSGGQRQRVAIARALVLDPRLIVCDEPVSALDLSTQARVLELLLELQERTGVAYLFISHDLSVVRHMSHHVAVMYKGQIVESGPAERVTSEPQHPYTRRLWASNLVANPERQAAKRAARRALAPFDDEEVDQ
jgi:peptide/nickel transport system ATP-binding protein